MGFEYLQRRELHNISWQLFPVLCHLHSQVVFLLLPFEYVCISLLIHVNLLPPVPDLLLLGTYWSWVWEKWCFNISLLFWAHLPSNPWHNSNYVLEVCSPEVQGFNLTYFRVSSYQDSELDYLTITASKSAPNPHASISSSLSEQGPAIYICLFTLPSSASEIYLQGNVGIS